MSARPERVLLVAIVFDDYLLREHAHKKNHYFLQPIAMAFFHPNFTFRVFFFTADSASKTTNCVLCFQLSERACLLLKPLPVLWLRGLGPAFPESQGGQTHVTDP